ncbi:hypothetical protein GOODEAATRI_022698 [Goodea atripinnis]|uniref:DNA-directed DNA polymerase n=1 Tax=Goodea atripinnis TaxID=208336 RepID=A0ABV0PG80_9TELE
MSLQEQQVFNSWYREAIKGIFDFEKEALQYCKNYVDILYQSGVKFRDEFFKETSVDLLKCITIASAYMKVFVTNFLPPKTLAIPSPLDYGCSSKTFSTVSIQ